MAGDLKSGTRRKFALAYLALAALVGAAVGLLVLFVERPTPPPPPAWSAWKPTASLPADRATQIGGHVAGQYHLPSGHRLVRVIVGGPGTASNPIRILAVAKKANATSQSDFNVLDASEAMMYILCGAGANCAIREGKATLARGAVLRREALELALYTFEYVPQAKSVVTFFPPKVGAKLSYALFFEKSDLKSELHHPLARTLPLSRATLQAKLPQGERKTIDELTTRRFFRFAVDTSNSGRVLVLEPVIA